MGIRDSQDTVTGDTRSWLGTQTPGMGTLGLILLYSLPDAAPFSLPILEALGCPVLPSPRRRRL